MTQCALTRRVLLTLSFVLFLAGPILAKDHLDESGAIVESPQSVTEHFSFTLDKNGPLPHLDLTIHMTEGRADVSIFDPRGRKVQDVGARDCTVSVPVKGATTPGAYTVEVTTTEAVGQWRLRIYDGPSNASLSKAYFAPSLAAGSLMMLVAVCSVWFWRRRTGVPWRWFWVGAAIWTIAVAVKFAIAIPLNKPIFEGLKESLPYSVFLTAGAAYGGVLTGVTEILFALIAALIWCQMASTSARGVAVGVGAGAFEAALLSIGVVVAVVATGAVGSTWGIALVPATERILAILSHTASRALVLLAVVRKRWSLFWYGFLLLSGVDAVATILHLTGCVGSISPWLMEALLAPFGLVSIPITIWCVRHWPTRPKLETRSETP